MTLLVGVLMVTGSHAQPSPARPGSQGEGQPKPDSNEARLEQAKKLFFQGNALRRSGDYAQALGFYVRSRALYPSVHNTINAAVCLKKLDRFDESLEMYETLIVDFHDELSAEDRARVDPEMQDLRSRVGSVDVIANVAGTLVIDGRDRGKLPLVTAVRVLPGEHTVHVMKEGFQTFEGTITVSVGQTTTVRGSLKPLAATGALRVDDEALAGAQVFVDGAAVGRVPWEGPLGPGPHVYQLRREGDGTAPRRVFIIQGQTAVATAALHPLGPDLQIEVTPRAATLSLGDTLLGRGRWQGRLPLGRYVLLAEEEGYHRQRRQLRVEPGMQGQIDMVMRVDQEHPRWGVRKSGTVWLDAFGGVVLTPSLGSGAEASCGSTARCSDESLGIGKLWGGRVGYEFASGLSLVAGGGYLSISKSVSRELSFSYASGDSDAVGTLTLADELQFSGGFAAVGVGYRHKLVGALELRTHLLAGVAFATYSDVVSGSAAGSDGSADGVWVQGSGEAVGALDPLLMPDFHLGLRFGDIGVSAGLLMGILPLSGPDGALGEVRFRSTQPCAGVSCAAAQGAVKGETSFGSMVLFVPSVAAAYLF
jgi:hypothetical protein